MLEQVRQSFHPLVLVKEEKLPPSSGMKVAALWFHWSYVRIAEEGDPMQRNQGAGQDASAARPGMCATTIASEQEVVVRPPGRGAECRRMQSVRCRPPRVLL